MHDDELHDVIASAHHAEVKKAREDIRQAISKTAEGWISKPAMCDALFLEFIEHAVQCTNSEKLAEQLCEVARKLVADEPRLH